MLLMYRLQMFLYVLYMYSINCFPQRRKLLSTLKQNEIVHDRLNATIPLTICLLNLNRFESESLRANIYFTC